MNRKPLQILAVRSRLVLASIAVPILLASTPAPVQAAAPAKPIAVDELLQGFAKMPGLYAEFRQESFFGMLAEPLVDEGTLHFADGRLARRTTAPVPSVVVMDGKGIEYGDGQKRERIDLDGKPAIKQFVEAFTMIFAGDRAGLETIYRIEFAAAPVGEDGSRGWTMTLVPKVAPMNQVIARVEISGSELAITKMRVIEVGGDETVTTFSKVDTKKRYSDAEKAKLFTVG
ncbi:MAG: outer membrane lipoprotein carrier protein LolA [Myxococcales bacterium]|nr:outer membrane lipoprotein carrier protein LolA [Myxococcales bacterium]